MSAPQIIDKLYAWVVTTPDGSEGVAGALIGGHAMPLVGADRERIESLRGYANIIRQETGYPVRLKVFTAGVVLDEIK